MTAKFGQLHTPNRADISPAEYRYRQSTIQKLDAQTAIWLGQYLESAEQGLKLSQSFGKSATVLWIVDPSNDLWFCTEELVNEEGKTAPLVRLSGQQSPRGFSKLGHPAIIDSSDKKARIGGEIKWVSVVEGDQHWQLSNKSGRYGIREDIDESHLDNVRALFEEFEISLRVYYIRRQSEREK